MALIQHRRCDPCGDTRMFVNGNCSVCEDRKKRIAEAAWNALTTDEKLLDLHRRLLAQEQKPRRYA